MIEKLRTAELFDCEVSYLKELMESSLYPWEIVPKINAYILKISAEGLPGFHLLEGTDDVLIGENVKIYPTATIEGPCIIGHNCELRPGAFIRGRLLTGPDCVIGNSTELKNTVLLEKVQLPHYNYAGDSVIGKGAHLGAGAICSNLKSDKRDIIIHADEEINTGLRKLGGIIGDGAEIGCGCVLNPGTLIGKNTCVYPLTQLRGIYPANCIVKGTNETSERK